MALLLRQATADRKPMPPGFVDTIWRYFDRGTRRAILELYRSAPEQALAAAGSGLAELECPALVAWGARDPYLPPEFGRLYTERLPHSELVELPDAGHWPHEEQPDVVIAAMRKFLRTADLGTSGPHRLRTPGPHGSPAIARASARTSSASPSGRR